MAPTVFRGHRPDRLDDVHDGGQREAVSSKATVAGQLSGISALARPTTGDAGASPQPRTTGSRSGTTRIAGCRPALRSTRRQGPGTAWPSNTRDQPGVVHRRRITGLAIQDHTRDAGFTRLFGWDRRHDRRRASTATSHFAYIYPWRAVCRLAGGRVFMLSNPPGSTPSPSFKEPPMAMKTDTTIHPHGTAGIWIDEGPAP